MTTAPAPGEAEHGGPRAPDVLMQSAKLEQALAQDDRPDRIVEPARALIRQAVAAGGTTWDPDERVQLRRAIKRWTSVLHGAGERIALPDLARFSGHLPSLEPIDAPGLLDLVRAGKPVVARRIEDADLRALHGIERVRIVDCVVAGCDLSEIELPGARLLHTTFDDCDLTETQLPSLVATSSIFARGSLARVRAARGTFCGTRFDGVVMRDGDFEAASFAASTLRDLDATGAHFVDALFDLATLDSVQLDRARISDVVFTGATVRSSTFHGADLTRSIFSSVDVRSSAFEAARLDGASFLTAVDVSRATFDAAALDVATFSPADAAWLRTGGASSADGG